MTSSHLLEQDISFLPSDLSYNNVIWPLSQTLPQQFEHVHLPPAFHALSASGLPSDEFMFIGFLPSTKKARKQKLSSLANITSTLVFYEAPHRIHEVLEDMQETIGDREVSVARELTKIHEEHLFGKLSAVRPHVKPLGEFVIVVSGATEFRQAPVTREEVLKTLGMTRNQLYDLFFKKKGEGYG